MDYHEFCTIGAKIDPERFAKPTQDQFRHIEQVYTYYPTVSEAVAKNMVANAWILGGMPLIKDMENRADRVESIQREIRNHRKEISRLEDKIKELRDGTEY